MARAAAAGTHASGGGQAMMLLGAFLGILTTLGLIAVYAGVRKVPVKAKTPRARTRSLALTSQDKLYALAGLLAGIALALFTGLMVAVLILPVAAVGIPKLLRQPQTVDIERTEALEEWVRSLAGMLGSDIPLTSALIASLPTCPKPIRAEVEVMVARLQARRGLDQSLYALAHDLGDQTGDFICSALIGAAHTSGAGLTKSLTAIATEVADEVRMRRDIATENAKTYASVRLLTIISLLGLSALTFTGFGAIYRESGFGQLVLLILVVLFGVCLIWIRRRATATPPARFLVPPTLAGGGLR